MAVVDVRPASPTYGQVLATEPVAMSGTLPHHLEYELPRPAACCSPTGTTTSRSSCSTPTQRRGRVSCAPCRLGHPYRYPHDFLRLAERQRARRLPPQATARAPLPGTRA
jgi:hypothetical protein